MVLQHLAYWQGFLAKLPAKQWYLIDAERSNIFRAIQLSLALSEEEITSTLREYWLTLSEQLFRFVEQRGYAAEWIPLLERIVERTDDDPIVQCQLLNRLGSLYRLVFRLDEAITIHQRALCIAQKLNVTEKIAHSHLNLGIDYRRSKQYDLAFQNGKHALDLFTQLSLTARGTAASLNLLGQVSYAQGHQEEAARYLQKAASVWRKEHHLPELARTLNNLARVYETQKQFDNAFSCYIEAKHALTRTNSELDITLICLSEGTLHFNLTQYAEASTVFKRIDLVYLEEAGHLHYLALALNNLGAVAQIQEKHDRAEEYLHKSLLLWQEMGKVHQITDTQSMLAAIQLEKKKKADQKNAGQP